MTVALFGTATFLSALLLFLAEPLVGRLLLPVFGGSAAVWTTCLLVYQGLLLAAYAWSHLQRRLPAATQPFAHLAVLGAALLTLPLSLPATTDVMPGASPLGPLVRLLLACVGLPFFALASSTPTLQRWFVAAPGATRRDPYALYGVSNAGSLAGLVLYPLVFEPFLALTTHRYVWSAGYLVLVVLVTTCLFAARLTRRTAGQPTEQASPAPTALLICRWILLALVPSSLTIGCTAYLSSELAPVPLVWVVPLAIYLVTYVSSFSGHVIRPLTAWVPVAGLAGLVIVGADVAGHVTNIAAFVLHLAALFLLCALCHGRLADSRPAPERLTAFYLWVSVGGVSGGLMNAVVAPALFHTALEYPLMLLCAPAVILSTSDSGDASRSGWGPETFLGLVALLAAVVWASGAPVPSPSVALLMPFGALVMPLIRRPATRMAIAVVATLLFVRLSVAGGAAPLAVDRSFYSVLRVVDNYEPGYRAMIHGATVHGMQAYDPANARRAVTYYTADGPVGQVFSALEPRLARGTVAVVGLGAGELAVYGARGQDWTFYEIDPLVEALARRYFTYLGDTPASTRVVIGDGRKSIEKAPEGSIDVLVLDAFSSDAIPVHLLTGEAMEMYRRRLRPGGVIAVHISNRFADLASPLAGDVAANGLCGLEQFHSGDARPARASRWAVIARTCEALGSLASDARWKPLSAVVETPRIWSDDRAALVSVLRWSNIFTASSR